MFTRLADAPTRFTSPPLLFRSCPVDRMTPLACRVAPAPAAALARSSHTASRNVRRCEFDNYVDLFMKYASRNFRALAIKEIVSLIKVSTW